MLTRELLLGDCVEVLKGLADCSVDSIVTDPPYGLSFMGKKWDYDVPSEDVWRECLRVLKPGGHLLAFAGTRTQHRMAVRIEDAGFEIRDMIAWVYGSGFPKSLDVSKAIDKIAGAEGEIVAERRFGKTSTGQASGWNDNAVAATGRQDVRAPATDAAKQWQGWGTALKPALEPITVARKPLIGTVAANVLEHGTGAINVDGCRVGTDGETFGDLPNRAWQTGGKTYAEAGHNHKSGSNAEAVTKLRNLGRFPANLIHDGSEEVVELFPVTTSGDIKSNHKRGNDSESKFGMKFQTEKWNGDTGSAARFFYCAKASKKDRDEGLDHMPEVARSTEFGQLRPGTSESGNTTGNYLPRRNHHPTVKPTDLMRYLCRLVTPPGGTVLDPFMGSGSTGKAAVLEGFQFIGIEREEEYLEIAKARIRAADPLFQLTPSV
jgi:site-specific DNA-methyltransferase (adenine-specific)